MTDIKVSTFSNGDKIESFDLFIYGQVLNIRNISSNVKIIMPRKRLIIQKTSKIYLKDILILCKKEFIKPGETNIEELQFLTDADEWYMINGEKNSYLLGVKESYREPDYNLIPYHPSLTLLPRVFHCQRTYQDYWKYLLIRKYDPSQFDTAQ